MGRSQESSHKKEVRTKQDKRRKEKEKKRLEKKEGRDGKSDDDMIAYVDEYGNITSTPPDLSARAAVNAEDIEIGVSRNSEPTARVSLRSGIVSFFNEEKGFGFLKDNRNKQSVFFHMSSLNGPVKQDDHVTFEVESGPKGAYAVNVTKEE